MPHCENYQMLISALLDDEITETQRADLMEHLETCVDCAAFLNDQLALKDALRGLTAQAPKNFSESIMARVRETAQDRPENEKKVLTFPGLRRWVGLAACCAVVAIGAVALGGLPRTMEAADCAADIVQRNENTSAPAFDSGVAESDQNGAAPTADYGRSVDATGVAPEAAETGTDNCEPSFTGERATLLAASGATVQQWVEDTLGEEWISGCSYYLTAEEYTQLRGLLLDAGEFFTEVTGTGEIELYLLQAE